MTQPQREKLQALLDGQYLIDDDENILRTLEGVTIEDTHYSLSELDDLEIYINPLQETVDHLKSEVKRLSNLLLASTEPKKRTKRPHLKVGEVKEIEQAIKKGVAQDTIMGTYDISVTTLHRIVHHTHGLSTPKEIK